LIHLLGPALIAVGFIGFLGTIWLPAVGTWLSNVELAPFFETTAIALPDGGHLTATMSTQRVQRYDRDGRFRNGWFVEAKGGHFGIGLTTAGIVAICTGRGRQLFLFDLEGNIVGHQPCFTVPRDVPKLLQPNDLLNKELSLQQAVPAARPSTSLSALLLAPLNPFVSWLIGLLGVLITAEHFPTFRRFLSWRWSGR